MTVNLDVSHCVPSPKTSIWVPVHAANAVPIDSETNKDAKIAKSKCFKRINTVFRLLPFLHLDGTIQNIRKSFKHKKTFFMIFFRLTHFLGGLVSVFGGHTPLWDGQCVDCASYRRRPVFIRFRLCYSETSPPPSLPTKGNLNSALYIIKTNVN